MTDSYLTFKRAGRNCLLCNASLPELERHPTVLKLTETEAAVREDLCPECWDRMAEREYFSYWITRRIQAGPSPEERRLARSERNEALWALFNALHAREDREEFTVQLFLLAHLLMKYRVLQYGGEQEDGSLLFLHPRTNGTYLVPDVPLDSVSFVDAMMEVETRMRDHVPEPDEESDFPEEDADASAEERTAP